MANIFTDGETPTLDYAEAARQLRGVGQLGNDKLKTETTERVAAAALLDIAASLNVIVGAMIADEMAARDYDPRDDHDNDEASRDEPDTVVTENNESDWLEVGDWVKPWPIDDVVAYNITPASKVIAAGMTEGEGWLELEVFDVEGRSLGQTVRQWAENFHRVDAPEFPVVASEAPALTDYVDDIDSDFDSVDAESVTLPKVKTKGKSKSKGD